MNRAKAVALSLLDDYLPLAAGKRERELTALRQNDPEVYRELAAMLQADGRAHALDELPSGLFDTPGSKEEPRADARLGRRIGAWRIVRIIGVGGMGTVYEAQRDDGQYQQQVALKCIRQELTSPALVEAFIAERNALAKLHHAGIAPLLDGGIEPDGSPWFAMRLVEGEPIDAWCDRHRSSITDRVRLLKAACQALAYAHDRKVLHQDVKPSNLLVTSDGSVQVVDFGLSSILDNERNAPRIAASPGYMAPEALTIAVPTAALDVYSMGMVMFRVLCGQLPAGATLLGAGIGIVPDVAADTLSALARQTSTEEARARGLPDSRALAHALKGDLGAIAARCTSSDPAGRYATMGELERDLDRWLRQYPVEARNGRALYRLTKFVARHRMATATAALALLMAASGLLALHRQRQQAEEEVRARDALAAVFGETLGVATLSGLGRSSHSSEALLLKTERKIRSLSLQDRPAVLARGLLALARSHAAIGNHPQARRLADEASGLADGEAVTGIEVQATLAALSNFEGRPDRALATTRAALSTLSGQTEERLIPVRLQLLTELARAQWNLVRHAEAQATLEQALVLARAQRATMPEPYIELLTLQGYWYLQQYRFDAALKHLREANALAEPAYPLLAAEAQRLLFDGLADTGRTDEAKPYAELQWKNTRDALGDAHPGMGTAWMVLGNARCIDGDLAGCGEAIQKAETLILAGYGEEHPEYGLLLIYRTWLMRIEGSPRPQLLALTRRSLSLLRQRYPLCQEKVANMQTHLAQRLVNNLETLPEEVQGTSIDEAMTLLEEVIAACRKEGLPPPFLSRRTLARLHVMKGTEDDFQRAEKLLAENQAFILEHGLANTLYYGMNRMSLAHLLYWRGRLDEADVVYAEQEADALTRLPEPNAYSRLNTVVLRRADIASRKGRTAEALRQLQGAHARFSSQYPDDHRYVVGLRKAVRELESTGRLTPMP